MNAKAPVLPPQTEKAPNFLEDILEEDTRTGKHGGRVATRFPPEPNGYLHIGHAKSICTNFGLAERHGGTCNLRFDDTNPSTEETEFVRSIEEDVRFLGFDWGDRRFFASDYFERLYGFAVELIEKGLAYVDSQSLEEIRKKRGDFYHKGEESPFRSRSKEENLDLFSRMRAGEFADGAHVLRAKIDMAHPNQNMRDPVMYRIKREHHHRTKDAWCIYPMYDFAHGLSDAIEGITHSICTLEFENHRPLYDWFLEHVTLKQRPQQIEFARLNLTYTVLSKRKLQELVRSRHVHGWDDPRMPTLAGLRRRGVTPEAIRAFCERIGVAKRNSFVDVGLFEHAVREDLNARCKRVLGVTRPLKVTIENYDGEEWFEAPYHPDLPEWGTRKVPFSRTLYIEQDDFSETPPKGWFRLSPGGEVRLRYAYFLRCTRVVKGDQGEPVELVCTYDPTTKGGASPDGRKVKGTIHWVSAAHAVPAEVRLYDRLFSTERPGETEDFLGELNPHSLTVTKGYVEPSVFDLPPGERMQLERLGYFAIDPDSAAGALVLNRTIGLKDSWGQKLTK